MVHLTNWISYWGEGVQEFLNFLEPTYIGQSWSIFFTLMGYHITLIEMQGWTLQLSSNFVSNFFFEGRASLVIWPSLFPYQTFGGEMDGWIWALVWHGEPMFFSVVSMLFLPPPFLLHHSFLCISCTSSLSLIFSSNSALSAARLSTLRLNTWTCVRGFNIYMHCKQFNWCNSKC